jgi:hypothetical protein
MKLKLSQTLRLKFSLKLLSHIENCKNIHAEFHIYKLKEEATEQC